MMFLVFLISGGLGMTLGLGLGVLFARRNLPAPYIRGVIEQAQIEAGMSAGSELAANVLAEATRRPLTDDPEELEALGRELVRQSLEGSR